MISSEAERKRTAISVTDVVFQSRLMREDEAANFHVSNLVKGLQPWPF